MTNPIYPLPEAIERNDVEGAFEITDGYNASTDLAKRKMTVPTGGVCIECGEDHARALRMREMGYTAWTPSDWEARVKRTKDKLPVELVAYCETARINFRRKNAGLEPIPATKCAKDDDYYFILRQVVRNDDILTLSGMLAAAFCSGDEAPMMDALARLLGEMKAKADEREQVKAQYLIDLAGNVRHHTYYKVAYGKQTFRASLGLARSLISTSDSIASEINAELDKRKTEKATKVKEYKSKGKGKQFRPDGTRFGNMEIVRLPLPHRSKAGLERKWTARDEGPIPTRFDRWSIDKRVFRAKKRSKGAVVLVDVSGSMSWTEDHLARVLEEVPAATIAIYSGTGSTGQLVIVADKGRCAKMSAAARHMLGGNIIDGPALEWLAHQPETVKLWMSDGGITGIGDGNPGPKGKEFCEKMLRKGNIQQVRDARQVIAILSGKEPFVPSRQMKDRFGRF